MRVDCGAIRVSLNDRERAAGDQRIFEETC